MRKLQSLIDRLPADRADVLGHQDDPAILLKHLPLRPIFAGPLVVFLTHRQLKSGLSGRLCDLVRFDSGRSLVAEALLVLFVLVVQGGVRLAADAIAALSAPEAHANDPPLFRLDEHFQRSHLHPRGHKKTEKKNLG